MSQALATITVLASDSVGTVKTVAHGLSRAPQILIASGTANISGAVSQQSYQKSFGVATFAHGDTVLTQYAVGAHSTNNQALTDSDGGAQSDCIIFAIPASDPIATQGKLSVTSIDGTNVVLTVTEVFALDMTVRLWMIAGDDLTWVELNTFQAPLAVGSISYINTRKFKPDFCLFFGHHLSQTPPFVSNDSTTHLGAVDSSLNQWAWCGGVNDDGGGSPLGAGRALSYMRAGRCIAIAQTDVTGLNAQASLTSMDSTGFTLNWDTINLASGQTVGRRFFALMVQGAQWSVGNFNSFTDTASHDIATAFNPEALMFVSQNKAASADGVFDNNEQLSIGFSQNKVNYSAQQGTPWTNTVTYTDSDSALAYLNDNTTPSRVGTASVTALGTNKFTWKHTIADPTNCLIGYINYATQPIAGALTTVVKTVKPHGGGDYTSLNSALLGELANHKNMITQNIILRFDCYAGLDTTKVTVPGQYNTQSQGYITGPSNYILIQAIDGHAGKIIADGTKYLLDINGNGNAFALLVRAEYARFKQIQIRLTKNDGTNGGGGFFVASTQMVAPTRWEFVNCIEQHVMSNGSVAECFHPPASSFDAAGISSFYVNCIAYDVLSLDFTTTGFNSPASVFSTVVRYNCMAVNCNQGFQDHSTVIDKNNVAIGCDNGWNTSTGPNAASDYNFSTCGPTGVAGANMPFLAITATLDAKGPHSANGLPVYVTDALGGDYRPLSGVDKSLIGQGVDLSADATYPFNFDIANVTRTAPWTIGPFHIAAVADVQVWKWSWVGGVSSSAAKLVCKYNLPETIQLQYSKDPLFGVVSTLTIASDASGVAKFSLSGLSAHTLYYYRTSPNSALTAYSKVGSFSTFTIEGQPASFTVAVGGCSDTGSNTNLYNAFLSYNPLLYINIGDLHYFNKDTADQYLHSIAFDTVHAMPKRQNLLLRTPIDYVYDDHDYGADNSDQFSASKDASGLAYRAEVPSYTLPGDTVVSNYNAAPDCPVTTITESGDSSAALTLTPVTGDKIDATAWRQKVSNVTQQPCRLEGSAASVYWLGGEIIGQNPPSTPWSTMHDIYGFLVKFSTSRLRVQNTFVFNGGDGISFDDQGTANWELHGMYIKYARDDAVEDDWYNNGSINDCLIDGCYDFMSCNKYSNPTDGSHNVVIVSNSLIRLQAMDGVFAGTTPNHEAFWKWDGVPAPDDTAPRIILNNVVFRADSDTWDHGGGTMFMAPPPDKILYVQNCTMCWLGNGAFPETLPPGFTLLTGGAALTFWNNAVADWKSRHPFLLADTTAPICSMFLPTDTSTISGNVDLWATAVDDRDVASVQFLVDGVPIGATQTTVTAYQPAEPRNWDLTTKYHILWDSHGVANGAHTLSVTAIDTSSNSRTSATISVTVSN